MSRENIENYAGFKPVLSLRLSCATDSSQGRVLFQLIRVRSTHQPRSSCKEPECINSCLSVLVLTESTLIVGASLEFSLFDRLGPVDRTHK